MQGTTDSPSEFLDRVERFLDTTDGLSNEEIAQELRSDGVDPAALQYRVRLLLRRIMEDDHGERMEDDHDAGSNIR